MNEYEKMLIKSMIPAYLSGSYTFRELQRVLKIVPSKRNDPLNKILNDQLKNMIEEYKINKQWSYSPSVKLTSELTVSDWNAISEELKAYYNESVNYIPERIRQS